MQTRTLALLLGRLHLGELSVALAARYGNRVLIEAADGPGLMGRSEWTAAELEVDVAGLAAAHRAAGLAVGATVLIAVENRVELLLHVLALARLGAVPAPVSPRLKPGEQAAVAAATQATGLIFGEPWASALPALTSQVSEAALSDWLAANPEAAAPAPERGDPAATALLLCTSGTTGRPKAAALSSRGLIQRWGLLGLSPALGRSWGPRAGRDRVLSALPLAHVMGLSVALSCLGSGVRWLHRGRFEAAAMLDLIEAKRPNVVVAVPTMFADLEAAGAARRDLSSVQLWVSGADAMPADRARRFRGYGGAVRLAGRGLGASAFVDAYGMVELSGPVAMRAFPPTPSERLAPATPYVVLPPTRVRVVDPGGQPLGWGTTGELQFRGPGVLREYREHRQAGPDKQGWFSTGDYARTWPGGIFSLAGRSADRLKISGFSVFPAEVEALLVEHPEVRDVAVVGLPDPRTGQRLVALVVPAGELDEAAFLEWAREQVVGYRRPRAVQRVEALPRGHNGKLDRRAATALAETLTLLGRAGQE